MTIRGRRSRTNRAISATSSFVPVATQPAVQSTQVVAPPSHALPGAGPWMPTLEPVNPFARCAAVG